MFVSIQKKSLIILGLIFLLGAVLRFYNLSNFPVGFHRDEAFLGYNAFSILKTGKDMTGHFLPLHLESFLYSPAGYSYFSIPFIFIFGLSEFSVRFASAFFGSLTILSTFFMTRTLFDDSKKKDGLGLLSAFLLSITPWHINLSRASAENVLVVFFISIGVWLFLLWIKNQKTVFFIFSFLSFFITLLIYQAPRAFLPLFLPLLFLIFLGKQYKKWILSLLIYGVLIVLPTLLILYSPTLSTRIRMLSIFQEPGTQLVLNEQLREDGVAKVNPYVARVFQNKVINYSSVFLSNYFKHFSYDFLFTENGLPIRYRIPFMGLLYPIDIIFLLFGILSLIKKQTKKALFLIGWVLLAPVGSGITFDDIPNLQRTLLIFPALSLISAYGLFSIEEFVFEICKKYKKTLYAFQILVGAILTYSLLYYLQAYYIHAPLNKPWYRQVGYKQLVSSVDAFRPKFKHIQVTKAESAPTIFFLFFNSYSPASFQKQELLAKDAIQNSDYGEIPFDAYSFVPQDCPIKEEPVFNSAIGITEYIVKGNPNILYVDAGACNTPRNHVKLLQTIKRTDNTPAFKILEYTP